MYIGEVTANLEDIAAKEVNGKKIVPGRISFSRPKKTYYSLGKVYQLLKKMKFEELEDIEKAVEKIKFSFKGTFAVDCQRKGKHDFKSVDVEHVVGRILNRKGFTTEYKEPKTKVYVDILDNHCFIGILVKEKMCRREYRVRINNQSLNGCLAYAVVKFSGIKKNDVLLDPFCKDGVIPIEAAMSGVKKVYAFDNSKNNIRNAITNKKLAKVKIDVNEYAIDWLDTLFKKNGVDKVVTNLFVSQRNKDIMGIITEFFHQAEFIVKKDITLITNKPEVIKKISKRRFTVMDERKIVRGDMVYAIIKLKKRGQPLKG